MQYAKTGKIVFFFLIKHIKHLDNFGNKLNRLFIPPCFVKIIVQL